MPYPKIELHVHLEATLRPERLLEIARRNDYPLPVDTVEGLRKLYAFRDFDHFIEYGSSSPSNLAAATTSVGSWSTSQARPRGTALSTSSGFSPRTKRA